MKHDDNLKELLRRAEEDANDVEHDSDKPIKRLFTDDFTEEPIEVNLFDQDTFDTTITSDYEDSDICWRVLKLSGNDRACTSAIRRLAVCIISFMRSLRTLSTKRWPVVATQLSLRFIQINPLPLRITALVFRSAYIRNRAFLP